MKFPKYPSLERAAEALKKQGFTSRFKLEGNRLRNLNNERLYGPEQVAIVEYHRFTESDAKQSTSIIFAVETEQGQRGLVVAQYASTYDDIRLLRFMDRARIKSKVMDR